MRIVVTGTRGIPGIQGGVETHCEELYPLIADKQHEIIVVRRPYYAVDHSVKVYKQVIIKDIRVLRNKHLEASYILFSRVICTQSKSEYCTYSRSRSGINDPFSTIIRYESGNHPSWSRL